MDSFFYYEMIDRYLNGTASEEERRFVEASYDALSPAAVKGFSPAELAAFRERMYREIVRKGALSGEAAEGGMAVGKEGVIGEVATSGGIMDGKETGGGLMDEMVTGEEIIVGKDRGLGGGRGRVRRMWRVAAAAVLLAAAVMVWLVVRKGEDQGDGGAGREQIASGTPVAVPPARQGAVLTLADGSRIKLDSIGDGQLVVAGAGDVVKRDGALVYSRGAAAGGEALYNTLSTGKGYIYKLRLPDGTDVWLDAQSSISYPLAFMGRDRLVTITGQAYFEVAQDPSRPFRVRARGMTVQVLGTHFNINAYEDESYLETTVLEGSVKVGQGGVGVVLRPGEQGRLDAQGHISLLHDVNTQGVVAWKNGYFKFDNAGLATVMRQLSRWYDVDVAYRGGIDPSLQFDGKMGKDLDLRQVLKILQKTCDDKAQFIIEGRKIIIAP